MTRWNGVLWCDRFAIGKSGTPPRNRTWPVSEPGEYCMMQFEELHLSNRGLAEKNGDSGIWRGITNPLVSCRVDVVIEACR